MSIHGADHTYGKKEIFYALQEINCPEHKVDGINVRPVVIQLGRVFKSIVDIIITSFISDNQFEEQNEDYWNFRFSS
jgi:hypothetical protein